MDTVSFTTSTLWLWYDSTYTSDWSSGWSSSSYWSSEYPYYVKLTWEVILNWGVIGWMALSIIAALLFLLGYIGFIKVQTITKRFYVLMMLFFLLKTVMYCFLFNPFVYSYTGLCWVVSALYYGAAILEYLYVLAVIVTILIAAIQNKTGGSSPYQSGKFRIIHEIAIHVSVHVIATIYVILCLPFTQNIGGMCYIANAITRFVLVLGTNVTLFVIGLILIIISCILCGVQRKWNIAEHSSSAVGGCFCLSHSFPIRLGKELAIVTVMLVAEAVSWFSGYLVTLLPFPIASEVLFMVHVFLSGLPPWILLSIFVAFNLFYWRTLGCRCCSSEYVAPSYAAFDSSLELETNYPNKPL